MEENNKKYRFILEKRIDEVKYIYFNFQLILD